MIYIERLPKPAILAQKQAEWTTKFLESGEKRPHSSKYGHAEIKRQLNAMSFHKCFYCERKLKDTVREIDHYVEVSDVEGRALAYEWENLYLACDNCNNKLPHSTIPVTAALNPCKDANKIIEEHISFDKETIAALNHSEIGLKTIQKFCLDSDLLDRLRAKALLDFYGILLHIERNKDKNEPISEHNKTILRRFTQKDQPFSLMFKILLAKYIIL